MGLSESEASDSAILLKLTRTAVGVCLWPLQRVVQPRACRHCSRPLAHNSQLMSTSHGIMEPPAAPGTCSMHACLHCMPNYRSAQHTADALGPRQPERRSAKVSTGRMSFSGWISKAAVGFCSFPKSVDVPLRIAHVKSACQC